MFAKSVKASLLYAINLTTSSVISGGNLLLKVAYMSLLFMLVASLGFSYACCANTGYAYETFGNVSVRIIPKIKNKDLNPTCFCLQRENGTAVGFGWGTGLSGGK